MSGASSKRAANIAALPTIAPKLKTGRAYYEIMAGIYAKNHMTVDTPRTRSIVKHDPVFRYWYATLQRQERSFNPDRSPNGPYARALEAFGFRDPRATWNVGETPKVRDVSELFVS